MILSNPKERRIDMGNDVIYIDTDRDLLLTLVRMASKDKSLSEALSLQSKLLHYNIQQQRDREKLVDEIVGKVLKQLSVSADVSDAVSEIKRLKTELDSLGR